MGKLILGIIAVFCLQVGFIAYNSLETMDDAVSKIVSYPVEVPNNAAEPVELADILPVESDAITQVRSDNPDAFRPTIAEHREVRTQLDRKPVKVVAKDPLFRPTVITIPPQKPVEFRFKKEYAALLTEHPSENYDVSVVQAPRQEKRSFLSRAIRKPYDLIKALGSKLQ